MGFEVELKFRVDHPDDLRRRLDQRGSWADGPVDHEDLYFAHPGRDFASTGEAFRVRGAGDSNQITYKGAKRPGSVKTREEIEVDFAAGLAARGDLRAILERLGFVAVTTVRKRRTSYRLVESGRELTVTIDEAEGLGTFAEVETLVANEGDLTAGQEAVVALGRALGLIEVEPRSYLRMVLEASGRLAANPPGQT